MNRALVVIAVALSLAACRSGRAEEGPDLDPLFTLPFAKTIEVPPIDHPLPEESADLPQIAYDLSFRFLAGGEPLTAPRLTVYPAQRASIRIINQISFVSDFDLEVAEDAFIADPVISIVEDGLDLDCAVVAEKGGDRLVLAWRLDRSETKKPIRTRNIVIGKDMNPVTVQLPVVTGGAAVGRTLLDPGVETLLTSVDPDGDDLTVFVTALPVRFPNIVESRTFILDDVTEAPERDEEPLIDLVGEMDPPGAPGSLTVSLATTKSPRLSEALHLDAEAAETVLGKLTVLASQTIAAAPEDGARIEWTSGVRCHLDYDVEVGSHLSVYDPIIETIDVGFRGRFRIRDGEPVLAWTYASLVSCGTFTTQLGDTVVSIECPETLMFRGELRIRGEVNIHPVGALTDGRSVVLVVRRAESR